MTYNPHKLAAKLRRIATELEGLIADLGDASASIKHLSGRINALVTALKGAIAIMRTIADYIKPANP